MSDKQKAIVALTFNSQTCTAALSALTTRSEDGKSAVQVTDLSVILKDLDSLLALIYNLATKLSLALKPSSPTYSASLPLLQDLAKHTSRLVHCTGLLQENLHGATLIKSVTTRVKEIIEALRALIQTFLNHAARGPQIANSRTSGDEYLVRTGTLHDLITNAKQPSSGIPKDNQSAVHQLWKSDKESLEDNFQEVDRMVKEAEREDRGIGDNLDGGWDELGLDDSAGMDQNELARAKNVHQILRLTTLLHKRILLDLLASPAPAPVSAFDNLLVQSNSLLTTSDDLVSTLYSPQDPNSVRQETIALAKVAAKLHSQMAIFFSATGELEKQLNALDIENSASTQAPTTQPSKKKADKKWFETCFDQIAKLCSTLSDSLSQTDNERWLVTQEERVVVTK
ncbi:hypothetical protein PAXRUDRAFT_821686 [Paxillus rubicundulus Ve08.2h10]|uniref:Uncharacterized protein n=1 Tax=Paxillus rubicundulus Ve08.2h10 TaxID=930991 RepID=A0A0D0E674_9AGAM|nr:hypothetical protein PAXRUDRAFT_821686 [Paxillus rubicundulus Ve08.2h10]